MFTRKTITPNRISFVLGATLLLSSAGLLLSAGCGGGTKTPITPTPTLSATFLRSVPLQAVSSNKTLRGRLAIWRNLMPSTDDKTSGVIATFMIYADDNTEPLTDIKINKISLVSAEDVWETTKVEFSDNISRYGGTIRNGPLWESGQEVDAVAFFQDGAGNTQQIRAVGTVFNAY
jgi:hypothetical protein